MEPLVSVIMPAYNGAKYIAEAIESVLRQTYTNWELIIIDDCSIDDTLNIVKKYQDIRIKILCNEKNMGISYSTNKGIEVSNGKYIALLDDDDMAVEKRLELQVDYMESHSDIDVLGGGVIYTDENSIPYKEEACPRKNPKYIKAMLLFAFYCMPNGSAMIRRSFMDMNNLKYQENCYGMQDLKFWIDSSKVGNITTLDESLLYHRMHECNESKKMVNYYSKERIEAFAEFQRESLKKSGFSLDEKEYCLINTLFCEGITGKYICRSHEQLTQLYRVLHKILVQGKKMDIDYYFELEHLCKHMFAHKIVTMDFFS